MGIKFRCPNGHKLNVKSFLAGKRGVCPDCGTTFRIPEEPGGSDIQAEPIVSAKGGNGQPDPQSPAAAEPFDCDLSKPAAAAPTPVAPALGPSVAVAPVARSLVTVPAGMPVATGIPLPTSPATMPAMVTAPGVMPVGIPSAVPAGMPRPAAPQTMPTAGDPIAEAPAAIWYVRPPSGGQYGPARGDIMRKWIAEGRVSGDSLVWREGWTDWRNAAQLFPSLAATGSTTAIAAVTPAVAPQTTRTASRYAARKKGGSGLAIAALVGLVVVCIVLVVVLVVVLTRQA
jgi:hypothetical protein